MSNYALVENGIIIVQQNELPTSWKNISGLHHSKDNEELINSVGWYTIQKLSVDLQPNEGVVGYTLTYENNKVIGTPIIKDNFVEENFAKSKLDFMQKLRETRDEYLRRCDWTQLNDVMEIKSQEWVAAWKNYRSELRNITSLYVDNNITSLYEVVWPNPPSD